MIRIVPNTDILTSKCRVIVCPTNTVGVMGRGLAKTINDTYYGSYKAYNQACRKKLHDLDTPFICYDYQDRAVLCVASKGNWRLDSTLEGVERGLKGLIKYLEANPTIRHLALPVLGSGAGNRFNRLDFKDLVNLHLDILNEISDVSFYLHV